MTAKDKVRRFWEQETCGSRYAEACEGKNFFEALSHAKYSLEPYIRDFARFERGTDKQVLEIGTGAGVDFTNWARYASLAVGIDLTTQGAKLTAQNLVMTGANPARCIVGVADAEALPFKNDSFDIVYSWGVLHHSPDTEAAIREVFRTLKPGGLFLGMIYHAHAWTCMLLWALHNLRDFTIRKPLRDVVRDHLESPGTKVYTRSEAMALLKRTGFNVEYLGVELSPGDLMEIRLSAKYQQPIFRWIQRFYPTRLIRLFGRRYGLYLLMSAVKPTA